MKKYCADVQIYVVNIISKHNKSTKHILFHLIVLAASVV